MFRGYASQHDAKRFGVRMTAKTFRALVILLPLLRHFERSEKSSYFSFRNTRLYWMFRGYASQHDAKRFSVRMTLWVSPQDDAIENVTSFLGGSFCGGLV